MANIFNKKKQQVTNTSQVAVSPTAITTEAQKQPTAADAAAMDREELNPAVQTAQQQPQAQKAPSLWEVYQAAGGATADKMASQPYEAPEDDSALRVMELMSKNKEAEEQARKRARNIAAIAAAGDALRNMGNLIYTAKGAVPQTYNNQTAGVQAQYEKDKAQRNAQMQQDIQNEMEQGKVKASAYYKKWKAQQDAATQMRKSAKDAADLYDKDRTFGYNAAKDERDYQFKAEQDKKNREQWEKKFKADEAHRKSQEARAWYSAKTSRMSLNHQMSKDKQGNTVNVYSNHGGGKMTYDAKKFNGERVTRAFNTLRNRGYITQAQVNEYMASQKTGDSKTSLLGNTSTIKETDMIDMIADMSLNIKATTAEWKEINNVLNKYGAALSREDESFK